LFASSSELGKTLNKLDPQSGRIVCMRISVEKWLKMGFKSVFAYLGLLWIPLMSASLNFLAMAKRGISVSLLMGLGSPQHFKVAPREPGGQRPGFEGENAQEKPWETHVHILLIAIFEASNNPYAIRTIHGICIPSLQQA